MADFGDPSLFEEFEKERETSDTILLSKEFEQKQGLNKQKHTLNGQPDDFAPQGEKSSVGFFVDDKSDSESETENQSETTSHADEDANEIGQSLQPSKLGQDCSVKYSDLKSQVEQSNAENIL